MIVLGGTVYKAQKGRKKNIMAKGYVYRRVADLMDSELEKVQADAGQDDPPKTNVVCFANDLPSPEKWEACKTFVMGLNKREVYLQAGNVIKALHLEDIASYCACGDAKARSRLCDILRELECRLGQHLVKEYYAKTLERNQRENELYETNDCDGLKLYTDPDSPEYDSEFTAAVKTIESV